MVGKEGRKKGGREGREEKERKGERESERENRGREGRKEGRFHGSTLHTMIISEAGHLYMFVGQIKYFCLHCLLNYFPVNTF